MKNVLIFTICLLLCSSHLSKLIGQNHQSSKPVTLKPYSLEIDKKSEEEIIRLNKEKISKQCRVDELLKQVSAPYEWSKLEAIEKLAYVSDESGRILLENYMLQDTSAIIRSACANALGTLRSIHSKEALIKALSDPNRRVQIYAAFALSKIGEKSASFKTYVSFYQQGNEIPYYSCHQGFLYIGTSDVHPYLLADMNNNDPFIAVDAAITLAKLDYYSDAFPALKNFLNHTDKYMRMAALLGLAYIGDQNSLLLVESKINDTDELVKQRAKTILQKYKIVSP